jgi:crossover junction endodeoxyribonuclease RusA
MENLRCIGAKQCAAVIVAKRKSFEVPGSQASRAMEIVVFGAPAPQGSKRHVGHGILVESSKRCKPWREAVHWAAVESKARVPGPVEVVMVFTIAKPKSAPKRRRTWPDRRPDLDKLQRSTLDALVSAGAIEDDGRVVAIRAAKVFPGECPEALAVPGAWIRVEAVNGNPLE